MRKQAGRGLEDRDASERTQIREQKRYTKALRASGAGDHQLASGGSRARNLQEQFSSRAHEYALHGFEVPHRGLIARKGLPASAVELYDDSMPTRDFADPEDECCPIPVPHQCFYR